eukprot:5283410-Prymnesium_polylepis.1
MPIACPGAGAGRPLGCRQERRRFAGPIQGSGTANRRVGTTQCSPAGWRVPCALLHRLAVVRLGRRRHRSSSPRGCQNQCQWQRSWQSDVH